MEELLEIVLDVDMGLQPPCEGLTHPTGTHHHDNGHAKYVMRGFCRHGSIQLCAGRTEHLKRVGSRCIECRVWVDADDLVFIEL